MMSILTHIKSFFLVYAWKIIKGRSIQSPPKESIHFCQAEYSKLREARQKVGAAPHPPLSRSIFDQLSRGCEAPPTFALVRLVFEYLPLPQVYFLLVETALIQCSKMSQLYRLECHISLRGLQNIWFLRPLTNARMFLLPTLYFTLGFKWLTFFCFDNLFTTWPK